MVQVPFHRSWAEKEPGTDLGVRQPGPCELGDLSFLCGEIAKRRDRPLAHLLAGCRQLDSRAFGERLHADRGELVVCRSQLHACVRAPTCSAQPFAVEEMSSGELRTQQATAKSLDRFSIQT